MGCPLLHMSSVWVSWSQSKVEFWLSDIWCFGDHILHLRFCFPLKQNCRPLFGVLPGCRCDGRHHAWLAVWLSLNQLLLGSGFSFLISWVCRKAQQSVIRERKEREIQSRWGGHRQGIRCRLCGIRCRQCGTWLALSWRMNKKRLEGIREKGTVHHGQSHKSPGHLHALQIVQKDRLWERRSYRWLKSTTRGLSIKTP